MKGRKSNILDKRKENKVSEDNIREQLYDIHPNIEKQIEKLLKKFDINKYDYKITHFLIDIIQNETLKILRNAKNIKKETIKKIKEAEFRQQAEEMNELHKDEWNEYNNINKNIWAENMGEAAIYEQTYQMNSTFQNAMYNGPVTNHLGEVEELRHVTNMGAKAVEGVEGVERVEGVEGIEGVEGTYDFGAYDENGRILQYMKNPMAMQTGFYGTDNNKYIYEGERNAPYFNMGNNTESNVGNGVENTENNNVGNMGSMGNLGNMENMGNMDSMGNMGNMGNIENMGNVGNIENMGNVGNIENVGNLESMRNMGNMRSMGTMNDTGNMENIRSMGNMGNMENIGSMGNMRNMENMDASLFLDENKNNELLRNSGTGNYFNQMMYDESNFSYVPKQNVAEPYMVGSKTAEANKSVNEQTTGMNCMKKKNENNDDMEDVGSKEILVIDEDSVILAIKEYIVQNIYRKKAVDFLYEQSDFDENKSNNYFVRRDITYPTTLPPHLPDDCSVNTVLPPWDLCYVSKTFEECQLHEPKRGNIGGTAQFQKWKR